MATLDGLLRSSRFRVASHGSFYDDKSQCPRPSHNDLFGGMYKIDDGDVDIETEFHHMLLGAIDSGKLFGLSENRTAVSALYFDLDFKGREVVEASTLVRIVQIIREVLRRAGGAEYDRVSSALIASSPSAREHDGTIKTGVHIIFPNILLGLSSMQIINVASRDAVEAALGLRLPPCNSWTDVFDLSVYRGGLRMLYVDKPTPCPTCQHPPCPKTRCRNGYVGQNRPYSPLAFVNARDGTVDDAVVQRMAGDRLFALGMFSIRRPRVRSESPRPPTFDASFPTLAEIAAMKNHNTSGGAGGGGGGGGANSGSSSSRKTATPTPAIAKDLSRKVFVLSSDRPRIELLQKLIREFDPSRFGNITVRSATINPSQTQYTVQVQGPGRHSCLNCLAGKSHSRSTVYFVVDAVKGVCQRCNSRSDKVDTRLTRKMCRVFKSPWIAFSITNRPLIRETLFSAMQVVGSLKLIIDNGNVLCMDPSNYVSGSIEDDEWQQGIAEDDDDELVENGHHQGPRVQLSTTDVFSPKAATGGAGAGAGAGGAAGDGSVPARVMPVFGVERKVVTHRSVNTTVLGTVTNHSAYTVEGAKHLAHDTQYDHTPGSRRSTPRPAVQPVVVKEASALTDNELGIPLSWRVGAQRKRSGSGSGGSSSGAAGSSSSKMSSMQVLLNLTHGKRMRNGTGAATPTGPGVESEHDEEVVLN